MVNFANALKSKNNRKPTNPIDIYNSLDRTSGTGPLRPVQEQILSEWYKSRKDTVDLILKLHTGEGKTLIGLLMLQSMINTDKDKCLYICPNKHLAKQVAKDADKFGIAYCLLDSETELPEDFYDGKRLLITHVQKAFNGKTIFGFNKEIIDTIILDDSHACIDSIKLACTIRIPRESILYNEILNHFEQDLKEQGEGDFFDIKNDKSTDNVMMIPYWSWIEQKSLMLELISKKENDIMSVKFTLPLLKNHLEHCSVYITSKGIEVVPDHIPIESFSFFQKANRRILMSATTQDDSFFIKGLGFTKECVKNPLTNQTSGWSGEKMILIPSLIDESLNREKMRTIFAKPKNERNVGYVSLISSYKKAEMYERLGSHIVKSDNIDDTITALRNHEFSKTIVFVNRYDGIDLPDNMCRVLMIDSLPFFDNLSDRYEIQSRESSNINNIKLAQKIEQGMGRSVRGEKDYSVILLVGPELVRFVKSKKTASFFSEQTRKQIDIGIDIADLAREDLNIAEKEPMDIIYSLINQSLKRNDDWKAYYAENMNSIKFSTEESSILDILEEEYEAEKAFYKQDYPSAIKIMQEIVDKQERGSLESAWYLQLLAKYQYMNSPVNAEETQKKAFLINSNLLKPKSGVNYTRIGEIDISKITNIKQWLERHETHEELQLHSDSILENLSFGKNHKLFEAALMEVGLMLGFDSHRPDNLIKKGADVLWGSGNHNNYFMFECKNEVNLARISISKTEAGQMNNHCGWFDKEYGSKVVVDRIMIIPTNTLSKDANFTHEVKVINKVKLNEFKKSIKGFLNEIKPFKLDTLTTDIIESALKMHNLSVSAIRKNYLLPVIDS